MKVRVDPDSWLEKLDEWGGSQRWRCPERQAGDEQLDWEQNEKHSSWLAMVLSRVLSHYVSGPELEPQCCIKPGVVVHAYNPSNGRQRQEEQKFKPSLAMQWFQTGIHVLGLKEWTRNMSTSICNSSLIFIIETRTLGMSFLFVCLLFNLRPWSCFSVCLIERFLVSLEKSEFCYSTWLACPLLQMSLF